MITELILTLKNRTKTIPYVSERREDGTVNHGFHILKNRPEAVGSILETQDQKTLRQALSVINEASTPFFTVGCEKDINRSSEGFWVRGYLEFSFNDPETAACADRYFQVFFDFNRLVWAAQFDLPVQYHFELEGAEFQKVQIHGFTAAVWITTLCFPTADDAWSPWNRAVLFFADFLASCKCEPKPGIY